MCFWTSRSEVLDMLTQSFKQQCLRPPVGLSPLLMKNG